MGENFLQDWVFAKNNRRAVAFRYFNPVGADMSGEIAEDPRDIPNNLMPFFAQVAVGRRDRLQLYGNDYDTIDGTGVRDYVHVVDPARSHVAAIEHIRGFEKFEVINIGTGGRLSVLELVREFEQQSGKEIKYQITPRRSGDTAEIWAGTAKAKMKLGFHAKFGVSEMCRDTWRWLSNNPNGYSEN